MRIVLADDEPVVRSAMNLILEQDRGLSVIGIAETAPELLHVVAAGQPDLVFLDWELPGLCPDDPLRELRDRCPHSRIIALSSRPDVRPLALAAGCDAFVSKGDPPEILLSAVASMRAR